MDGGTALMAARLEIMIVGRTEQTGTDRAHRPRRSSGNVHHGLVDGGKDLGGKL